MTLTNYWWLLIWLFVGGAIFGNMPKRYERLENKTVERWKIVPALLMVLPFILWAGFRHDNFGDTGLYRRIYLATEPDFSQILSAFGEDKKDPGFIAFSIVMRAILGDADELFFLMVAIFQMLIIALYFRKYSPSYWSSIFLFVASTDYLSWMHNGMRQFIAVVIILTGFGYLVKKRYVPLVILILIASLFHGSAMLMIPIIFIVQGRAWNRKTVLTLLATMVVVAYIDRFTPILNDLLQETQYDDMMTNEIWTTDDGTHIIRVLVYSIPALLSLVGLKYVRAANNPIMNICVNCSIVTMALYLVSSVSSGIYMGRLPIYTTLMGYIALPWLIDHMFVRRSATFVKAMMFGGYLAFFYYQMHFTWGMI